MESGQWTDQKFEWSPFQSLRCRLREHESRGGRITKQNIDESGATIGCPGCNAIKKKLLNANRRMPQNYSAWSRKVGSKK